MGCNFKICDMSVMGNCCLYKKEKKKDIVTDKEYTKTTTGE